MYSLTLMRPVRTPLRHDSSRSGTRPIERRALFAMISSFLQPWCEFYHLLQWFLAIFVSRQDYNVPLRSRIKRRFLDTSRIHLAEHYGPSFRWLLLLNQKSWSDRSSYRQPRHRWSQAFWNFVHFSITGHDKELRRQGTLILLTLYQQGWFLGFKQFRTIDQDILILSDSTITLMNITPVATKKSCNSTDEGVATLFLVSEPYPYLLRNLVFVMYCTVYTWPIFSEA